MITTLTTSKKKLAAHLSAISKKMNKSKEFQNNYRAFKSMTFMQNANDLLAAKWQKFEVYPFCD